VGAEAPRPAKPRPRLQSADRNVAVGSVYCCRQRGYIFIGVFLFSRLRKPILPKFGGKVAHRPRKKRLDFGGDIGGVNNLLHWVCFARRLFNSNNFFAGSAVSAEVCALLNAILVRAF